MVMALDSLKGLNVDFATIWSHIILTYRLPLINKVFFMVLQYERMFGSSISINENIKSNVFLAKSGSSFKGSSYEQWRPVFFIELKI